MNRKFALPTYAFFAAIAFLLALILLPGVSDLVVELENNAWPFVGTDVRADYLAGVIWAFFLGTTIYLWPVPKEHKPALLWIYTVKTLVTLGIMLAYEAYFGVDTDGYFVPGETFAYRGFELGKGTYNVRQLSWLQLQLIPESFHAAKVGFSMVGMLAIYIFYRAAAAYLRKDDLRILYLLGFFPTVVFWSSLLCKDPIALFGMALYSYGVIGWHVRRKIYMLALMGTGILISVYTRPWYGMIMLIPFMAMVLVARMNIFRRLVLAGALLAALGFSADSLRNIFQIEDSVESALAVRGTTAQSFAVAGGSSFAAQEIPDSVGVALAAPAAIFTALFRPFPWEAHNPFALFLSLENMALLIVLLAVFRKARLSALKDPVIVWLLTLIAMWGMFYGLVIYNFGALARFKMQIVPIMLGLILMLHASRKTQKETAAATASAVPPAHRHA